MASMAGDASPHNHLPSLRAIITASGSANMTMGRSLPPIPPNVPQRDVFLVQRNFMPSPPNTHEVFFSRPMMSPAEHIVPPPSPAYSADSCLGSVPPQGPGRLISDIKSAPVNELYASIRPQEGRTRKKPLQQCGRKRTANMAGFPDVQKEKHRVAEADRRKNLSVSIHDLDDRVPDHFLKEAGWNLSKNSAPSKEHILKGSVMYIDQVILVVGEFHDRLLEAEREIMELKERNRELGERDRAVGYQSKAHGHMCCRSKSEQPNPQEVASLPDIAPKVMLPGLNGIRGVSAVTPDFGRFEALSAGTFQFYGQSFISRTPPSTGPSSPVFNQAAYSTTSSRPSSSLQSP
ncbi:putative HLH DNA binding domain protein [Aspergillus mulundensis]|uniref:BHLH domain-containing protein n=1 Tax=Aspergillus mulundensis TaxID=1810919 RepID=A0A3D8Q5R2_9EURO|nr:hypothetical protein DSM5745_11550 [Aspergillus mulundensis]RDW57152.1 hypothetical protein DSM5745_11550 [Aspergillus mulundensis]